MSEIAAYLSPKYKFLVRVPAGRFAVPFLLLSSLLTGALLSLTPYALVSSLAALAVFPLLGNYATKRLFLRSSRIASLRRINQLTLLESYIILAGAFLDALSATLSSISRNVFTLSSLSLSTYIRSTVLSSFDSDSPMRASSAAFLTPTVRAIALSVLPFSPLAGVLPLYSTALGGGLALAVALVFLRPVEGGLRPLKMVAASIANLLNGYERPFEENLTPLCRTISASTDVFVFRSEGGEKIALIVSPFHVGPMRNVGSSMLPYFLERAFKRRGMKAVFLKGCSTHDLNLVSKEGSIRVSEEVAEAVQRIEDGYSSSAAKPSLLENGRAKGMYLNLGGRGILIPTLHPDPMEDIPPEVAEDAEGFNVTVVDPHNSFKEGFKRLSGNDVSAIKELVAKASLISEGGEATSELRIALARTVIPDYGLSDGIGPGGFSLLGLEVGRTKVALAVVDSNNSTPDVRDEVVKELLSSGWDYAELLTTDTHFVNGIRLGGKGYAPLGEKVKASEIAKVFSELSREALNSLSRASVRFVKVLHEHLKVFSSEELDRLVGKARSLVWLYLACMLLSFLLPLLLLIAL